MVWFFVWQTPFIALMFIIGLACRAIFDGTLSADEAESGLPMLAQSLNPILGGVILASIFAATMSTADSQVLACTAAITDDIKPRMESRPWEDQTGNFSKQHALATAISLVGQQFPGFGDSVFALVVFAVYGLGGIFVHLFSFAWPVMSQIQTYHLDDDCGLTWCSRMDDLRIWRICIPIRTWYGCCFCSSFHICWKRDGSNPNPFGIVTICQRSICCDWRSYLNRACWRHGRYSYQALLQMLVMQSDKILAYSVNGEYSFHEIAQGSEFIEDGGLIQ